MDMQLPARNIWSFLPDARAASSRIRIHLQETIIDKNRSEPMSILCMRFRAMKSTLKQLREDHSHPKDAAWAAAVDALMDGPSGFQRVVKFGVDCDFAVAAALLIRLQDKPSADISLSVTEVTECLEICHVLFEEGRVFDLEDNHTYTGHLLRSFLKSDADAAFQPRP